MQLPPQRVYCLKKNYRNNRQIAAFAAQFYVGLKSGLPDAPTRSGDDLPTIVLSSTVEQGPFWDFCATRIARFARSRLTEEIGVLIPDDKKMVKSFCNRLKAKLADTRVSVQAYVSNDDAHTADELKFDIPGHVSVLSFASAKGLEFDRVFVVDPGRLLGRGSSEQGLKMKLYVMSSRARDHLEFIMPRTDSTEQVMSWLKPGLYNLEQS
jgi:DNA helicase IV